MADVFSVDLGTLADSVARMQEFQRVAEALLTEVDNAVKSLRSTWSGEASAAQAVAQDQWSRGAASMREALTQLHCAGAGAHGNYTAVMSANRTMWS